MADDEKARLYKEVVRRAPDYLLLDRMKVHGFWPDKEGMPQDPPAEAAERTRIESELKKLRAQSATTSDPEKALDEERKRRWDESKKRRKEAKEKREAARAARATAWAKKKEGLITHLGLEVSGGLQGAESDKARLAANGLPELHTGADVAALLGVSLKELRWLSYHRRSVSLVHYHRYQIPKKTGGMRAISAPKRALAAAQRKVLLKILSRLEPEPQAHGFVIGKSIVTNATPHVGRKVVINMDLRDFFPTITFRRVKGLLRSFGYSEQVATVLSLLLTEPTRAKAELDGKVYHVALGDRMLPQGACTSPAITNLLCRRLDKRLSKLASNAGFSYTRYADDLTFSSSETDEVGRLLRAVRAVLGSEGFEEHAKKTKVMRRGRRQEVTGLTVNTRPAVSRADVRELRAILHNASKTGIEAQNRQNHPNFEAHLRGRVAYVAMIDPAKGQALRAALDKVLGRAAS